MFRIPVDVWWEAWLHIYLKSFEGSGIFLSVLYKRHHEIKGIFLSVLPIGHHEFEVNIISYFFYVSQNMDTRTFYGTKRTKTRISSTNGIEEVEENSIVEKIPDDRSDAGEDILRAIWARKSPIFWWDYNIYMDLSLFIFKKWHAIINILKAFTFI